MKHLVWTFAIFSIISAASSYNYPGVKISFKQPAAKEVAAYFFPGVLLVNRQVMFPNLEKFNANFTNIRIQNLNFSGRDADIVFNDQKLSFATEDLSLDLLCYIKSTAYSAVPLSLEFAASSRRTKLSFVLSFESVAAMQVLISDFKLIMRDLESKVESIVAGKMSQEISKKLQPFVEEFFNANISEPLGELFQNEINAAISRYPSFYHFWGNTIGFNHSVAKAPTIKQEYVSFGLNGSFHSHKDHHVILPATDLTNDIPEFDEKSNNTFQAFISEYSILSLLFSIWQNGYMTKTITSDEVSSHIGFGITISLLRQFIPNIENVYDLNSKVTVTIQVVEPPVPKFTLNDMQLDMNLDMTFLGVENGYLTVITRIRAPFKVHLGLSLQGWALKANLISGEFGRFTIISGRFTSYDPSLFQAGMNTAIGFAKPLLNNFGQTIPLPFASHFDFQTPAIAIGDGYLFFEATPKFIAN